MELGKEKRHLVMMAFLLALGIITFIASHMYITSVSELYESQKKSGSGKLNYSENLFVAMRVQYTSLIIIISAYVPYIRFRASLDLIPYYNIYRKDGAKDPFLLAIFHEKMLHFEFINLVVYLTLFIFVFCLFALENYKPENILRMADILTTPSEEEVMLYLQIFNDYGGIFDFIKTALLLIGEGCLTMEELTWRKIKYHYEIIKLLTTKTPLSQSHGTNQV